MANKKPGMEVSSPTYLRTRLSDGRVIGVDGSVWLVRRVPLEPVADAKSVQERMNTFVPLLASFDELAAMSGSAGGRRALARNSYRQVHVLMVNLHRLYNPPAGHPIAGYLKQAFPHQVTERRVLLLAVQLQPKVGGSGGLRAAIDSVVETITIGGAPMSDFDDDHRKVDSALTRCGLTTPSTEDMTISNSWWNQGHFPDTVELPHSDHLHVFSDATAVRMAKQAGPEKCDEWPTIPNHRILTMSTLEGFDFDFIAASDPAAHWATGLIEDGAVAISIRGRIEPASITRQELRRQRKRYLDDINEAADNGKMERSEQTEMVHTLEQVEGVYASQGGSPTLVDASCLVAFDGEVEDITQVGPSSAANLRVMNFRQRQALSEMMLCSPIRSNPNLHDMPSQVVAASGIQSLSTVGDKTGALVGFTERDQQPAYVSPTAASANDAAPLFNNVGATGSGKTMLLLWKAWQYAKMGGPQIIIDPKALALDTPIPTPTGWTTMGEIGVGDQVFGRDGKPCIVTHKSRVFTPDETRLYEFILDDGQVITADQNHQWVVATPKDRTALQRGDSLDEQELARQAVTVENLVLVTGDSVTLSTNELLDAIRDAGATRWGIASELRPILERRGVIGASGRKLFLWPANVAFKALSAHLREEASMGTNRLRVLTTDELLKHGVKSGSQQSYYALPAPSAVEYDHANLSVDPYLLGAWLGDGTTKAGSIVAGGRDADEMERHLAAVWPGAVKRSIDQGTVALFSFPKDPTRCKRGHRDFVPTVKGSIRCRACGTGKAEGEITNGSLGDLLSDMSLLGDKHIPEQYLRGSVNQRLSLLQGLMDTDGTVHVKRSELRITLTNRRLAEDVLALIRSLGIKAHWHESPAVLVTRDENGDAVRKTTGTAYAITFQTDKEVFRLARKRQIQPKPKFRSNFLYIKEIRQVESAEAQCIRVDSVDHTYLVGDFVPTHNTGSDHSAIVYASGGQVASLDQLQTADGIFDPIRFSLKPEVGVELAASMLASINPWGADASAYEVPLYNALSFGVSKGAKCIGEALDIALAANRAHPDMVRPIKDLADSSPMFRACVGINPTTKGLAIAEGITLIKVGDSHLNLPEPSAIKEATLMQRISLALVRMMVFGSAMALTGRGGAIHLDEAWVFFGAGKTEVERLGRLARSQNVLPEMYTQRATDALNAGLAGYISRGIILPIEDEDEARAALKLFKLEDTPERMSRITAKATIGDAGSVAPNWTSMRALRDPVTGRVLRGSVGYYIDLSGRAVPIEIKLPPSFLKVTSTNPDDIRRRLEEEALQKAGVQGHAA